MNALSVIILLPANETEADSFKRKLKAEILATNDLNYLDNIAWFKSTISNLINNDFDVINHIAKLKEEYNSRDID
jgi:hypothetical protein